MGKELERGTVASEVLEELVARAGQGDRGAQEALLVRYRPFIRSAVRARLGPGLRGRESTSDLEQEVALEVLRALPRHAWQGRSAFLAWLRRIAADEVIDAARFHAAARRDPAREAPAEIGEVLGCSEEAARKHVARGRARLAVLNTKP